MSDDSYEFAFDFNNAPFDEINAHFNEICWDFLKNINDVDECIFQFYSIVNAAVIK